MAEWFVQVDGKKYGPFDAAKLVKLAAAGQVKPTDRVRKGREGEWQPASKVRRLFDAETQAKYSASKQGGASKKNSSAKPRGSSKSSKPAARKPASRRSTAKRPAPPKPKSPSLPAEPLFDLSEDFGVAAAAENPFEAPQSSHMPSSRFESVGTGRAAARRADPSGLFSSEGRVPRRTYWIVTIATNAVLLLSLAIFIWSVGIFAREYPMIPLAGAAVELCVFIACLWAGLAVQGKRWHDRDKSSIWILINFVPYVGAIWVFVELGFLRGTVGNNAYGPDPT